MIHACLHPLKNRWLKTDCPNVGPDAVALTDAQIALPWPDVTSDDNGATFRAMTPDEITHGPRTVQLAALAAKAQALLDASDCKVLPDSPYPADVPTWTALRDGWRGNLRAANQPGTDPATITITLPTAPLSLPIKDMSAEALAKEE